MRLMTGIAFTTLLFATCATDTFAQSADPAATLAGWVEAYAAQKGARSAAVYTEDASVWGTASKSPAKGRAAISDYFGRPREGVASISVTFDEQDMQPLGDGVTLAYGRYTFRQKRTDGTEGSVPARFSMVLVKGSDGLWRIAHHHSSPMPR